MRNVLLRDIWNYVIRKKCFYLKFLNILHIKEGFACSGGITLNVIDCFINYKVD